jgi:glycosyltransferase involved in cell wall biosynthesis
MRSRDFRSKTIMKTIGLVCEAFTNKLSGGRAALAVAHTLRRLGYTVAVYVTNPDIPIDADLLHDFTIDVTPTASRFSSIVTRLPHLPANIYNASKKAVRLQALFFNKHHYIKWLAKVKPKAVHFASFHIDKPPYMINEAGKRGLPVILQPWVHSYACYQGFGFRDNNICTKCFAGDFRQAAKHHCVKGIPSALSSTLRGKLRKAALKYAFFLASSNDMVEKLLLYGVPKSKISVVLLPYEITNHDLPLTRTTESYFLYYSAIKDYKGIDVLKVLLSQQPHIEVCILPMAGQMQLMEKHGLTKSMYPNLKIVSNLHWGTEIRQHIRNARGILIPSLWPTTGEYVLLEAMALGKAVVAFDVGMHKDVLIHGYNAMVAAPENWSEFIRNVVTLYNNSDHANFLGKNAIRTIDTAWSPSTWDKSLKSAYEFFKVV